MTLGDWRGLAYTTRSVADNLHPGRCGTLRGQYVYYLPRHRVLPDRSNGMDDFLGASNFAQVRYMDQEAPGDACRDGVGDGIRRAGSGENGVGAREQVREQARPQLSPEQLRRLKILLAAGEGARLLDAHGAERCAVMLPRVGMVSAWASKARDILRNCGLDEVATMERARLVEFSPTAGAHVGRGARRHRQLYDELLEDLWYYYPDCRVGQDPCIARGLSYVRLGEDGIAVLNEEDELRGLCLSDEEKDYFVKLFAGYGRDPTDAELMMFAQLNSEHCRHKIFNAQLVGPKSGPASLFAMIKNTGQCSPEGIVLAYSDNAAVIEGAPRQALHIDPQSHVYRTAAASPSHWLMKVETHNHPTAISPYNGAGTGVGGEIRDEAAVGRGSRSLMGLAGYSTSYLRIPGFVQAWEAKPEYYSNEVCPALDIMLAAPLGTASFANEFGRPNVCGYFRAHKTNLRGRSYGYHKPVMVAGGVGTIEAASVQPGGYDAAEDTPLKLVVLGGPALLVGLGGGSASSGASFSPLSNIVETALPGLDLQLSYVEDSRAGSALNRASVQRQNPQMQRRCQEVIDRCAIQGEDNPIVRVHDVGGGGLANAVPELLHGMKCGAKVDIAKIPSDDPTLSPMELWCNESQERFLLAVREDRLKQFERVCARERCPYGVVGQTDDSGVLLVRDETCDTEVVNMPLKDLFSEIPRPKLSLAAKSSARKRGARDDGVRLSELDLTEACRRVLSHPTVASKDYLINIADRTVGGLVCRDQMVGRWQVPVSDCAVSCADYHGYKGIAMALGERAPIAVLDPVAATRMAVGEALTNLAGNPIARLNDIKLSANWMAAADDPRERRNLVEAVRDLALQLCPELGMAVVMGKDSLSMRSRWRPRYPNPTVLPVADHEVIAPLTAIITAVTPIEDVRRCKTPELLGCLDTHLLLIDLGRGQNRMGASCLAEVHADLWGDAPFSSCPDLDSSDILRGFMGAMNRCHQEGLIQAYHDRSDGGLFVALLEMCFTARFGAHVNLDAICSDEEEWMRMLFSEELGALIQVKDEHMERLRAIFEEFGLADWVLNLGHCTGDNQWFDVSGPGKLSVHERLEDLESLWREPSLRLRALRDNPSCIAQERELDQAYASRIGTLFVIDYDHEEDIGAPYAKLKRPRIAVLREQGSNGHYEMAAAFDCARFEAVDVHTGDIFNGDVRLDQFQGMAVVGGFSYGDVFGAGRGWAYSILWNERARAEFEAFFARTDTFTLGVCNGCQMLSCLRELIPGSDDWPRFGHNLSGQFESRLCTVEIVPSTSVLMSGMEGSVLPIPIAHGEGRALLDTNELLVLERQSRISLRYSHGVVPAWKYPTNPNGSVAAIAGVSSEDGRVTIMMPHPERVFRTVQYSWKPDTLRGRSPWLRMFDNARHWVANN